jgi:hypothetical protein
VHTRQVAVEHNNVVLSHCRLREGIFAAVSDIHGEPGVPQPASRGGQQRKIVLDEQDAHPTSIAVRRFSVRAIEADPLAQVTVGGVRRCQRKLLHGAEQPIHQHPRNGACRQGSGNRHASSDPSKQDDRGIELHPVRLVRAHTAGFPRRRGARPCRSLRRGLRRSDENRHRSLTSDSC